MIYLIADFQYNTISGSTIDYIDLYYNLKKYLPVKLIILVNYNKYLSVKKILLSYFNKKIVKELIKYFRINADNIKENDTIICKYGCLLDNYINIEKYKNIYIIADLRLACHCIVNINRYYLYHSNIKGIFTSPFLSCSAAAVYAFLFPRYASMSFSSWISTSARPSILMRPSSST